MTIMSNVRYMQNDIINLKGEMETFKNNLLNRFHMSSCKYSITETCIYVINMSESFQG